MLNMGNITLNSGTLAISGVPAVDARAQGPQTASTEVNAQGLQPAGRISLAVDFPTEGQLFHFKKVKANARLGLTVVTPETFVRWKYLAVALVLAALLTWINRVMERRRQGQKRVADLIPETV